MGVVRPQKLSFMPSARHELPTKEIGQESGMLQRADESIMDIQRINLTDKLLNKKQAVKEEYSQLDSILDDEPLGT